jgi:hypothetical protein
VGISSSNDGLAEYLVQIKELGPFHVPFGDFHFIKLKQVEVIQIRISASIHRIPDTTGIQDPYTAHASSVGNKEPSLHTCMTWKYNWT